MFISTIIINSRKKLPTENRKKTNESVNKLSNVCGSILQA